MNKAEAPEKNRLAKTLDWIETVGNKLPDPALLFLLLLALTWLLSWPLSLIHFDVVNPKTGEQIQVVNQLTGAAMASFLASMVKTFTGFHPLGVVLVALLGVGVAESTGFINACIKKMLSITPTNLITPALILVAIVSHTAADAGYVLVIPLGGVVFYAAGRHPLAGIAAAFAGVSGGFSANFLPSGVDPLLQGLTQAGGQLLDPELQVNPLCNWLFTSISSILIILVGWYLTDKVIEPRLKSTVVDGNLKEMPKVRGLTPEDEKGLRAAFFSIVLSLLVLAIWVWMPDSAMRSPNGGLTEFSAPLMQSIVPLIFLLFLIPGIIFGYISGSVNNHRDIINGMSHTMSTMGYYLVLAFFAAQFIAVFGRSNLGILLAIKGAAFLQSLALPGQLTIGGIILLTALINLLIGSASAKWALLSPIFVPMLMQLGYSPELTQAAYRIGDSTTNIITPLMPYFPLVVVFCQRYVTKAGVGTLVALMLPYSVAFLICWTLFFMAYWALDIPLGLQASYSYP